MKRFFHHLMVMMQDPDNMLLVLAVAFLVIAILLRFLGDR